MTQPGPLPRYQLTLFGRPALSVAGTELPISRRKFLAALAYLHLLPGHSMSRRRLAMLLWPDSTPDQALTALRQAFKEVRSRFPGTFEEVVASGRIGVALRAESVQSDYAVMLETLDHGRVPAELMATRAAHDTFLAGFEDIGPGFREWMDVQRKEVRGTLLARLSSLTDGSTTPMATRRQIGTALCNIDPSNELGCRLLMQSWADEGNISEAMRVFDELSDRLATHFGTQPSSETVGLRNLLQDGGKVHDPAPSAAPAPSITIHVSEFDAASLPPGHGAMLRVFKQDLIVSLLKFRHWEVVETPIRAGMPDDPSSPIGFALGCIAVQDDDDLILMVTVRDTRSGRIVWGETFRADVAGWFRSQRRIIRSIAGTLLGTLPDIRLSQIGDVQDMRLGVNDRWLRGQSLLSRWDPNHELRAEKVFKSIISERPDHASALASLARFLSVRHAMFPGLTESPRQKEEALAVARRAVMLDPANAMVQAELGWCLTLNGLHAQAASAFRQASDLNPNDLTTVMSSALGLSLTDSPALGGQLADTVIEDGLPLNHVHHAHLAIIRFLEGRIDDGLSAVEIAGATFLPTLVWKMVVLAVSGRLPEAMATREQLVGTIRRRWFGQRMPTDDEVGDWVARVFAMGNEDVRAMLAEGMRLVGFAGAEAAP